MRVPPEITFRNLPESDSIRALVYRKAEQLSKVCGYLQSCRVAIELPHHRHRTGNRFRVRIDLAIPPSHEIVVDRQPLETELGRRLSTVVREAFDTARRQLKELVERQRGDVKNHPLEMGFVVRLLKQQGYGFLRNQNGREVYFHRHSVLGHEWDHLDIGTGVRFEEEVGEKGPQASTVQIVDKPGARVGPLSEGEGAPPLSSRR